MKIETNENKMEIEKDYPKPEEQHSPNLKSEQPNISNPKSEQSDNPTLESKQPDAPNLDLIGMVQQARMLHDAAVIPSQMNSIYWIEVKPQTPTQTPTVRAGQWVIETDVQHVDELWVKIKAATEAGELGYKSKVATIARSRRNPQQRIICARTYDSADQADVERVKLALQKLGITSEMQYERDQER